MCRLNTYKIIIEKSISHLIVTTLSVVQLKEQAIFQNSKAPGPLKCPDLVGGGEGVRRGKGSPRVMESWGKDR